MHGALLVHWRLYQSFWIFYTRHVTTIRTYMVISDSTQWSTLCSASGSQWLKLSEGVVSGAEARRSANRRLVRSLVWEPTGARTKSRLSKTTWSTRVLRPSVLVIVEVIHGQCHFECLPLWNWCCPGAGVHSGSWHLIGVLSGPLLVFRTDSLLRSSSDEVRWPQVPQDERSGTSCAWCYELMILIKAHVMKQGAIKSSQNSKKIKTFSTRIPVNPGICVAFPSDFWGPIQAHFGHCGRGELCFISLKVCSEFELCGLKLRICMDLWRLYTFVLHSLLCLSPYLVVDRLSCRRYRQCNACNSIATAKCQDFRCQLCCSTGYSISNR